MDVGRSIDGHSLARGRLFANTAVRIRRFGGSDVWSRGGSSAFRGRRPERASHRSVQIASRWRSTSEGVVQPDELRLDISQHLLDACIIAVAGRHGTSSSAHCNARAGIRVIEISANPLGTLIGGPEKNGLLSFGEVGSMSRRIL